MEGVGRSRPTGPGLICRVEVAPTLGPFEASALPLGKRRVGTYGVGFGATAPSVDVYTWWKCRSTRWRGPCPDSGRRWQSDAAGVRTGGPCPQ